MPQSSSSPMEKIENAQLKRLASWLCGSYPIQALGVDDSTYSQSEDSSGCSCFHQLEYGQSYLSSPWKDAVFYTGEGGAGGGRVGGGWVVGGCGWVSGRTWVNMGGWVPQSDPEENPCASQPSHPSMAVWQHGTSGSNPQTNRGSSNFPCWHLQKCQLRWETTAQIEIQ